MLCGDTATGGSSDGCQRFLFKGVSWFGMEETYGLLQGLERQPMRFYLEFAATRGFNALRVPLAVRARLEPRDWQSRAPVCAIHPHARTRARTAQVTNVLSDVKPTTVGGLVEQHNPSLHRRSYLQVLDALVGAARDLGLLVLLDLHRLRAGTKSQTLWYDAAVCLHNAGRVEEAVALYLKAAALNEADA